MQNLYDGVLAFKGRWRSYQERVLREADRYLADHKIHIVAAPGSGKTTLGIELIRRLGQPCLILSPSITIRQQWLERIEEGFLLDGCRREELLSNDLRNSRPITAITYQALYSAMKQYRGQLNGSEDEEEQEETTEAETVDFQDFHIFEAVEKAGIKTICLDEAHHLRSEWWKALETFMKNLKGVTVISLTATPPYDSTPGQWKRYIDLCGPIDEEIFTPELVREGSLCPHEDYIYFNWPAKEELKEIEASREKVEELRNRLLADGKLKAIIATHQGLLHPEEFSDQFLDHPSYFSALLIFCQAQQIPFPDFLKELIGTKGKLPALTDRWLEILLQGLLYEDTESYRMEEEQREALIQQLKEAGCIYRKKVTLTRKEALQKLLAKSQGKMESIGKIAESEYSALGEKLRLLVLCDYIKKDQMPLVGTEQPLRAEIGAVPIFETLRRKRREGLRLGCLSGSVVLLPLAAEKKAMELLAEYGCRGSLTPIGDTEYGQFEIQGENTCMVAVVTELFQQGEMNVLIGTKSLLGEGWDAPCINSLILATYVGSFMLSNQMRGRSIRADQNQPEKTGNIWHLACIFPQKQGKTKQADFTGDYEMLARRFNAFLGVSWKDSLIESGMERLALPAFQSRDEMEAVNRLMLKRAADRGTLRERWRHAIREIHGEMEVEQMEAVPREAVKAGYLFWNAFWMEIFSLFMTVLCCLARAFAVKGQAMTSPWAKILGAAVIAAAFLAARYGVKLFQFSTPERIMKRVSQAVVNALGEVGELEEAQNCKAEVASAQGILIGTWLKGGSMRDKTTFACCMEEIWGIIDNPRYLFMRDKRGTGEYYSVPEVFGRQKERAAVFEKHIRKALGKYRVVYTRTAEGRKTLLRARTRSFVNKNQEALLGKKVVKGKYE